MCVFIFLEILNNTEIQPKLNNVERDILRYQDGAPPHSTNAVSIVYEYFEDR